jgi:acetamidase/formamidase
MKRLGREHHIHVLEPNATPAITIDSGEELMLETWDAFEGVRDLTALEARSLKGPATGPSTSTGPSPAMPFGLTSSVLRPKKGRPTW